MIEYVGDGMRHNGKPFPGAFTTPEPYVADPPLIEAVNVARYLGRPLLLEGDPGCGKTRLAYAVAYELGTPLKECYVRSNSRASDFLYTFDGLRRLYDIQEAHTRQTPLQPSSEYIKFGSLGQAIKLAQDDIPSVVLIDEVDKADIDFPNDLLQVLDEMRFEVSEDLEMKFDAMKGKTRDERRDSLPLFIITSNQERELPKAFLRRCLFYYIKFPDHEMLKCIVENHFQKEITSLFLEAIKQFWALREAEIAWRKLPSTSELLDWIRILELDEQKGKLTAKDLLEARLSVLPHLETLVKTENDRNALYKYEIDNQ
jgi:MoxR-like ATPase